MTTHPRILAEFRRPWLLAPGALQDLYDIAMRAHAPDFERAAQIAADRAGRARAANLLSRRRGIAVLPIHGPIFPRANLFTEISGATSIDRLTAAFREARADKDIAGIVLDIDSPGGAVTGVSEFAAMVRASSKPVVAYAGGMMASAAYWIGSAAHSIAVADTSWSGSIGVASMYYIDDDASVVEVVSTQSPLKRKDVRTDEGRAIAQRHVDELADVFIGAVAQYRGLTPQFVREQFGKGDVLIGHAAERIGMVDSVSTFEDMIRGARNTVTSAEKEPLPPFATLIHAHGYDRAAAMVAEYYAARS